MKGRGNGYRRHPDREVQRLQQQITPVIALGRGRLLQVHKKKIEVEKDQTIRKNLIERENIEQDFDRYDFFIQYTGEGATKTSGHRMFKFVILKRLKPQVQ